MESILVSKRERNVIPAWSDLPSDMIFEISRRIDTSIDNLRFRSVCSWWRSSSVLFPPHHPFAIVPIPDVPSRGVYEYEKSYNKFVILESTVYSIQPVAPVQECSTLPTGPHTREMAERMEDSKQPFIIKGEELLSGNLRLIFPLSRVYLRHLSMQMSEIAALYGNCYSESSHRNWPQLFNFSDCRVKVMGKAYGFMPLNRFYYSMGDDIRVHKVVVSSNFNKVGEKFAVMIVDEVGVLYVWKVGDEDWTKIDYVKGDECMFMFVDIIFREGKFYALDYTGLVLTVDPQNFKTAEVAPEMSRRNLIVMDFEGRYRHQMYIIESMGDLLWIQNLVDCYEKFEEGCERVDLVIYKLDKVKLDWIKMDRLEDRVLFLGDDARFSCSTKEFNSNKGSCLYFKFRFGCAYTNRVLGVVGLENGNLQNCKIAGFDPSDYYFKMLYLPAWVLEN